MTRIPRGTPPRGVAVPGTMVIASTEQGARDVVIGRAQAAIVTGRACTWWGTPGETLDVSECPRCHHSVIYFASEDDFWEHVRWIGERVPVFTERVMRFLRGRCYPSVEQGAAAWSLWHEGVLEGVSRLDRRVAALYRRGVRPSENEVLMQVVRAQMEEP